jgi:putative ubiquitin-RnfH superfamily antitoxin RatB of RatAB toxin-antitoxin module
MSGDTAGNAAGLKHCLVAVDTPDGPRLCTVALAGADDLEVALQRARALLGEQAGDWQHGAVGVWGRLKARSAIPADGDRIELYRALALDPRQRRRQRARATRGAARPLNSPGR